MTTPTTKHFNEAYTKFLHEFNDVKDMLYPFIIGVLLVSDPYPSEKETEGIMKMIQDEALALRSESKTIKEEYETTRLIHENLRLIAMGVKG